MRRKMAPQPHTALQVGSAGSLGRSGSLADVTVLFERFPLQVGGECWMESLEARREGGRRRSGRAVRFLPD